MNQTAKQGQVETVEKRLNRIKEIALRRAEAQNKMKVALAPRPEKRFNFLNRKLSGK